MKSFPKHFKVDLHSGRQVGVAFREKGVEKKFSTSSLQDGLLELLRKRISY